MGDSPTPMGWDSTTLGGGGFITIRGRGVDPLEKEVVFSR